MKLYMLKSDRKGNWMYVWAKTNAHAMVAILNHDDCYTEENIVIVDGVVNEMAYTCLLIQGLLNHIGGEWTVMWSGLDMVIYTGTSIINRSHVSIIDTPGGIVEFVHSLLEIVVVYHGTGEDDEWPGLSHLIDTAGLSDIKVDESLLCDLSGCSNEFRWSRRTPSGFVFVCNDHRMEGDEPFDPRCDNCGQKSIDQESCGSCSRSLCPNCIHDNCNRVKRRQVCKRCNSEFWPDPIAVRLHELTGVKWNTSLTADLQRIEVAICIGAYRLVEYIFRISVDDDIDRIVARYKKNHLPDREDNDDRN